MCEDAESKHVAYTHSYQLICTPVHHGSSRWSFQSSVRGGLRWIRPHFSLKSPHKLISAPWWDRQCDLIHRFQIRDQSEISQRLIRDRSETGSVVNKRATLQTEAVRRSSPVSVLSLLLQSGFCLRVEVVNVCW